MESITPLKQQLRIIHFNDCYELLENAEEPRGGAARLVSLVKKIYNPENTLVFFSGDLFSPSSISAIHRGSHMLPFVRESQIDVACIGNHQFDLPLHRLTVLIHDSGIPWLLSNLRDSQTQELYANSKEYHIIEKCGLQIGLMGIVEKQWIDTLKEIKPVYQDFIHCSQRLCQFLKSEGCNFIIALTHMRLNNDQHLADTCHEIDIVLGGHDHLVHSTCQKNSPLLIKTGGNFSYLSEIMFSNNSKSEVEPSKSKSKEEEKEGIKLNQKQQNPVVNNFVLKDQYIVTQNLFALNSDLPKDQQMNQIIDELNQSCKTVMLQVIGYTDAELDIRFQEIRSQGTNFTNFFSDVIRQQMKSDICLLNSGSIRLDSNVVPGKINFETIIKILPFNDQVISQKVKGKGVHQALENGISKLPSLDGRFLCISGVEFICDIKQEPFSRIPIESVIVNGAPLDLQREYSVSMIEFMGLGKEGFESLGPCEFIIDPLSASTTQTYFMNFFNIIYDEKKFIQMEEVEKKQGIIRPKIADTKIADYQKLNIIRYIKEIEGHRYITIAPTFQSRIQFIQ